MADDIFSKFLHNTTLIRLQSAILLTARQLKAMRLGKMIFGMKYLETPKKTADTVYVKDQE